MPIRSLPPRAPTLLAAGTLVLFLGGAATLWRGEADPPAPYPGAVPPGLTERQPSRPGRIVPFSPPSWRRAFRGRGRSAAALPCLAGSTPERQRPQGRRRSGGPLRSVRLAGR